VFISPGANQKGDTKYRRNSRPNSRPIEIRTESNFERVRDPVSHDPLESLSRRSTELEISKTTHYEKRFKFIPIEDSHHASVK
jgi:hypothetical protein